jgi:thioredoxin 1
VSTLPFTHDATFEADVLASDLPVLVEFTADWCPPCKMIAPVLAAIADELAGRLRVLAIDADTNPETMRRYHVLGMPTLTLFVGGEVVLQVTGARPKAALLKEIEPHLTAVTSAAATATG